MTVKAARNRQIKILIVDDHELLQLGLKNYLEAKPDIQIVGTAGEADEAIAKVDSLRPDVVLMDIRLRDRRMDFRLLCACEK